MKKIITIIAAVSAIAAGSAQAQTPFDESEMTFGAPAVCVEDKSEYAKKAAEIRQHLATRDAYYIWNEVKFWELDKMPMSNRQRNDYIALQSEYIDAEHDLLEYSNHDFTSATDKLIAKAKAAKSENEIMNYTNQGIRLYNSYKSQDNKGNATQAQLQKAYNGLTALVNSHKEITGFYVFYETPDGKLLNKIPENTKPAATESSSSSSSSSSSVASNVPSKSEPSRPKTTKFRTGSGDVSHKQTHERRGEVKSDGAIYYRGSYICTLKEDGSIYKNSTYWGYMDEKGNIFKGNETAWKSGQVEVSSGTAYAYKGSSRVGYYSGNSVKDSHGNVIDEVVTNSFVNVYHIGIMFFLGDLFR